MNKNEMSAYLAKEWQESGVDAGDVLLVHSSLKRVLHIVTEEFGYSISPGEILESLLQAVGEEGTLILPLFNFNFPKAKFFDIRNTKSHMGALTEAARQYPHAVRTGHPIYSFAVLGKESDRFKNLYNYSGYGEDSPFSIIQELNGKIAVIGLSDQNSMTSYHYVEEQNQVEYRYYKEFEGEYIDWDGSQKIRVFALFVRKTERGIQTDVNRMMDRLWEKGLYSGFKPDQRFGMRTIPFNTFYEEVDSIIKKGQAHNYLYSLQTEIQSK